MKISFTCSIAGILLGLLMIVAFVSPVFAIQEQIEVTAPEEPMRNPKIDSYTWQRMQEAKEDELIWISVIFEEFVNEDMDVTIDELLADVADYKERLEIIQETYESSSASFIEKYFPGEDVTVYVNLKFEEVYISISATKSQILEYAEEDSVIEISCLIAESNGEDSWMVLVEAKAAARARIRSYKNLEDYREAQQDELQKIIEDGLLSIKETSSVYGVRYAMRDIEAKMDAVKTNQQLTDDENADKNGQKEPDENATPDIGTGDGQELPDTGTGDKQENQNTGTSDYKFPNESQSDKDTVKVQKPTEEQGEITEPKADIESIQPEMPDEDVIVENDKEQTEKNVEHERDVQEYEKLSSEIHETLKVIIVLIIAFFAGCGIWLVRKKK